MVCATMVTRFASADVPTADKIAFFEREIRPALIQYCYDCHSAEQRVKGGLQLDSHAAVRRGGDSGTVIVPGKPQESLLIEAIRYKNLDLQMPPRSPMPDRVIAAFEKWIADGAIDPRKGNAKADPARNQMGMSIEEGRQFWAFRPIESHPVPATKFTARVQSPIDAFVFAKLEQNELSPAPPADKLTLIRRLTQNLIGLPPTPEDIEAYLSDETPEATDRLIERLLNSPHYGVRFGRHWLDVARYADSNGLDENLGYGQAWRYRDYVVNAFNNDKPYDQFLIEQIAGDLIPGADRETKTATGFLALGAKVLAEPDRRKLEMDIIDEQLDTLGKAFLGMTLGCVRCHDHKFDPIKQSDYYALAAIFKSTKTLGDTNQGAIKHWFEHSFADQKERERLKQVEAEISKRKSAASKFKTAEIAKIRSAARESAADYLAAAALFDITASLSEVATIAKPRNLHPRILHHCRTHLEFNREQPLFQTWHDLIADGRESKIREHYQDLFERAERALADKKKQEPKATAVDDPLLNAARTARLDPSGFLAVPAKESHAFDAKTLQEYYRLMDEARAFESTAMDETAAMGVGEGVVVDRFPIHIRGSYKNHGAEVERDFPAVMRLTQVRPVFPSGGSGRLELARWMADTRHPLTARVIVNRVWGWHFGSSLVQTTENFGKLGDRPSHPKLLDWLAHRFMADGWSIKKLNRLILKSSVYQMASRHPDQQRCASIDPQNRFHWRADLRRLEAEQIRDSILAVSGRLDPTLGGKTLPLRNRQFVFNHTSEDHTKYDSLRRAIYLPVIRNNLYPFFQQFDYPDPTMPSGSRASTVIAPQNLLLMNDQLVMDSADALAEQISEHSMDELRCLSEAYQRVLGRQPTSFETDRAFRFLTEITSIGRSDERPNRQRAWSLLCQSLFASNEFMYLR